MALSGGATGGVCITSAYGYANTLIFSAKFSESKVDPALAWKSQEAPESGAKKWTFCQNLPGLAGSVRCATAGTGVEQLHQSERL